MPKTVAVNQRALVARIERALRKQDRELRTDRRGRQTRYLIIDTKRQSIVSADVELVTLARELGCMEKWERLET